jgi:hypothetical protein
MMLPAKARVVRRDKALSPTALRDIQPPTDPAICFRCQAVWRKGKWSLNPALRREVLRWEAPAAVICPACRRAKEGNPTGILYLAGSFLERNRAEILNLVRNAERVAAAKNPLERIIRIQDGSSHRVVVETTSEKLARRLGRAVSKACGGTLEIRFSHEDKLVRVYWRRDLSEPSA